MGSGSGVDHRYDPHRDGLVGVSAIAESDSSLLQVPSGERHASRPCHQRATFQLQRDISAARSPERPCSPNSAPMIPLADLPAAGKFRLKLARTAISGEFQICVGWRIACRDAPVALLRE